MNGLKKCGMGVKSSHRPHPQMFRVDIDPGLVAFSPSLLPPALCFGGEELSRVLEAE